MRQLDQSIKDKIKKICAATHCTQAEIEFVVEKYIYVRKGYVVDINITKNSDMGGRFMQESIILDQLHKLNRVYEIASLWLMKNYDKY